MNLEVPRVLLDMEQEQKQMRKQSLVLRLKKKVAKTAGKAGDFVMNKVFNVILNLFK